MKKINYKDIPIITGFLMDRVKINGCKTAFFSEAGAWPLKYCFN